TRGIAQRRVRQHPEFHSLTSRSLVSVSRLRMAWSTACCTRVANSRSSAILMFPSAAGRTKCLHAARHAVESVEMYAQEQLRVLHAPHRREPPGSASRPTSASEPPERQAQPRAERL